MLIYGIFIVFVCCLPMSVRRARMRSIGFEAAHATEFARRGSRLALLLLLAVTACLAASPRAFAESAGCGDLRSYWSGGITLTDVEAQANGGTASDFEQYDVDAGETMSWSASGSSIAPSYASYYIYTNEVDPVDLQDTISSGTLSTSGSYTFPIATTVSIQSLVNYSGSGSASITFTASCSLGVVVSPGAPTIGTATAGNGQATVSFAAPASNGGAAITSYTATSSPGGITASASSSPITVTGLTNGIAYTFTVTATNSAGTGTASAASNSVTPKGSQTITFNNPGTQNFGTSPTLSATSDSALAVTFTSSTTAICTITSGGALTFVAAGTCTIHADQAGNAAYLAATTVSQSFAVNAILPGPPTIGTATAGNGQATVSFTAPASSGGAAITSYTVTSSPGGITASASSSPITVTGLINGTAYTFTVTATNSAGTGTASAASNSVTPKGSQTITFNNPGTQNFGTSPTLSATSDSALAVTFTSSTTAICTITSGGALTFVAAGTCTIHADQAGNAAYLAATTVSQSFAVNAVLPGAPTIGTATAGNGQATVSFTAPASNGGAAITSYIVTSSPGGITASASSSPITVTGLINGTAYTFTVTATTSAGTGTASAASNSVTPVPALAAPVANAVSASVAANSSANPITLNITGGTPASVAVASAASHGTATASGTAISYTPTAGYSGADSFTYTATNATGTSAPATVTITVTAPTFGFSPAAGALTAGTVGTAYSDTIAASGGTAPYTYIVTSGALPAGLSLAANGAISGTPTTDANYSFTVTATDANGVTGTATYSLSIGAQAPVANAVSASVAANSSANPITLNITGGTPASVAVASAASHGTATASGTAISYTPTTGYSGADSFTYTATNATGTSAPATVTITVTAPTFGFSPAAGALTTGTVGTAYSATIAASGGTAPYTYIVTSGALPAGLSLAANGAISGTPTTAANYSFTVTATDANGVTGTATYSLSVHAGATVLTFTPAAGTLPDAMAGEEYSQTISATGGTGALIYSLSSGTLPRGMVLNISTGQLSGPLDAGTEGDYSFSIQVRDGSGATAAAAYTLKVKPRAVTVTDKVVTVPPGSMPPDVYLNRGATGGPFTQADLTFVEPANAGTATIIQGQVAQAGPVAAPVGWYLHFTPNPAYSGRVRVGFRLISALGISNTGTVIYNLGYDPAKVAEDIDRLVHGFVQSRQNMIASSIKVPGLFERRQMEQATDSVSAHMMPSENGMTLGFSTSLAQMEAARSQSDGGSTGYASPFNVWIDGAFLTHNDKEINGGKWGSFAIVNMGADYLLSEKALLGVSLHYDRMTDPTDSDAELTGNGWLAGPYASLEIGKNLFWNGSLLYGGSTNTIDTAFWDGKFDTKRWMVDTSIDGAWNIDEDTVLTPKLRAVYFSEKVEDYAVNNSAGDTIIIDGFDEEQLRLSLGAEIARSFTLENGSKLTPKLGLTGGFSGLDGSGAFGSLTAGLSLQTADQWMVDCGLLLNIEGEGEKSVGAKVGATKRF